MEEKSCCFTGHRIIQNDKLMFLEKVLDNKVDELIKNRVTHFYCGGALGFDTIAALCVIRKKGTTKKLS